MKKILFTFTIALSFFCKAEDVSLRGYGKASIKNFRFDDGTSGVVIDSESPEKAALWQAKYLSDISSGVLGFFKSIDVLHGAKAYPLKDNRGYTIAVLKGTKVFIAVLPDEKALNLFIEKSGATKDNTISKTKVPMYLDKWDKYSFSFYFRTGCRPDGVEKYDESIDFDFAKKSDDSGMIFWAKTHPADRADGINDSPQWDWAFKAAERRSIPVTLNIALGDNVALADAYRSENKLDMPGFAGTYHRLMSVWPAGHHVVSWASKDGRNRYLYELGKIIDTHNSSNVVDILEPHGELAHGPFTPLTEFGPCADKSWQEFLKERYSTVQKVASRHGVAAKKWEDFRLPEIAQFAGFDKTKINLAGKWYVKYPPLKQGEELHVDYNRMAIMEGKLDEKLFDEKVDVSDWDIVEKMPETQANLFLPKRPAVFRREFSFSKPKKGRWWLYVWDLNMKKHASDPNYLKNVGPKLAMNGKILRDEKLEHDTPHYFVEEVTDVIKEGKNSITLYSPCGFIAYRCYLTQTPPAVYPYLSDNLNRLWADFSDWQGWSRAKAVERSFEMIRSKDKDKSIICMAPDVYANQLHELCLKYGGRFHNTGSMGGFHFEALSMMMRGRGMPFSVEPGGPADTLMSFKRQLGLWLTEGVNAIHYFIHVGNIAWNKEIREHFEKMLPALKQMGASHRWRGDAALYFDSDSASRSSFPWQSCEYDKWQKDFLLYHMSDIFDRISSPDGLMPDDFSEKQADRYKLVIDTSNVFMFEKDVKNIANWISDGGTFVALNDTARHHPEKADVWLFEKYGGTRSIDKEMSLTHKNVRLTPEGEALFPNLPKGFNAYGVRLKENKNNVVIYRWEDGTPAMTCAKIGKGNLVTLGLSLSRVSMSREAIYLLYGALVDFSKSRRNEFTVGNLDLYRQHNIANNGMTDVWVVWNPYDNEQKYSLTFSDGKTRSLTDITTGKKVSPQGILGPRDTIVFTSPRLDVKDAPSIWAGIQRDYWKGDYRTEFKINENDGSNYGKNTIDISSDWLVNGKKTILTSYLTEEIGTNLLFTAKRKITIPQKWNNGEVALWCLGLYSQMGSFNERNRPKVRFNGKEIKNAVTGWGIEGVPLPLKAGESGEIEIEFENSDDTSIRGLTGSPFLTYTPYPSKVVKINGSWRVRKEISSSKSYTITLPSQVKDFYVDCKFTMPKLKKGAKVIMRIDASSLVTGGILNGSYVRRHHHYFGPITHLDVTQWVKEGENELILAPSMQHKNASYELRNVEMWIME